MGLYMEGEIPTVVSGNGYGNNGGMWGSDGIWAILLLALLGNRGFGFGGGYGGGSYGTSEGAFGWQLGRLATTNDVASGFSTSEIMSDLNDIILGQAQGFAGVQQTLCQGFSGVNTALMSGFHGVDNAICTLGYQTQQSMNSLSHQLSDCCCGISRQIDGINYNNAKNTSEIIQAINYGNQRLIDIYTNDKIETLNRKLSSAEAQLSNNAQSRYIVDSVLDRLSPCPKPAFLTCNPATGLVFPQGSNGCCGCNGGF